MKGVSEISGLRSIKSMHSTGKRSIPKEDAILEKRKAGIQKRLEDVKKEMEVLEKASQQGKVGQDRYREVVKEEPQEKKWKKMALSY